MLPFCDTSKLSPPGYELCSVSVLENALNEYNDNGDFPNHASDIINATKWVKKGQYVIKDAQPSHYNEPGCATVHGGRDCESFHSETLPKRMFVSSDCMAMSTFNGPLESGVNAGRVASTFWQRYYDLILLQINHIY
jgi:hypothetical protein